MNPKNRISDFSSLSVICSVDKFVKTVDSMNETIMVPSRLLNVEVDAQSTEVPDLLRGASSDPYTFFSVLNDVKNSIVWGLSSEEGDEEGDQKLPSENTAWMMPLQESRAPKEQPEKTHARRISAVSMGSIMSSCSSEAECAEERSDAGDSGVDAEEVEPVAEVTANLKKHLQGLQKCLSRLTETAVFITEKYQEEVKV